MHTSDGNDRGSASSIQATRRTVVTGALGITAAALAACGSSEPSGSTGSPSSAASTGAGTASGSTSAASGEAASSGAGGTAAGPEVLAKTSEIPVGSGKLLPDQKIVVTQPTAGNYRAMSAVCTHERCIVGNPEQGRIACACHNSVFGLDGAVQQGPATQPLPKVDITVEGDTITRA